MLKKNFWIVINLLLWYLLMVIGGFFFFVGIFVFVFIFWRSENVFVLVVFILSFNSVWFFFGFVIFFGFLIFIVDFKNIVNVECIFLYSF